MLTSTKPPTPEHVASYYRRGLWRAAGHLDAATVVAKQDPTRIAYRDRGGACTYEQFVERTDQMAHSLRLAGVGPDSVIVFLIGNRTQSVVAYHAALRTGAGVALLADSADRRDIDYAMASTGAKFVLAEQSALALARAALGVQVAYLDIDALPVRAGAEEPAVLDPDAARVVVFTSGTTAHPKGVLHTLNTLSTGSRNYVTSAGWDDATRPFVVSPLASITGVLQALHMSLSVGATAVLEGHWDAAGSLDFAAATGANFLGSPPVLLERLLREARRRGLRRLPIRAASLGGAALSRRLLDDASATFGIRIQRVYGSSEAPNTAASQPTDRPEGHVDDGVLLDGVDVSVGTAANPGECRVRGAHLFHGYVDDRDTQASFDGDWFCTGDLVDLRAGRLSVVGRIKEIAIRNGVNVSLNEVDEALAGLAGVTEWAACRLPDDDTGERVALAVSAADRSPVTLEAVRSHLRSVGLAPRKWPEQVIYWPGPLPRTATGKVRRDELAADARLTQSEFAERLRH